ncbi:retrotransposon protein, putative, ty1-copia subclass [Tanacetum coccineum]
MVVQNFDLRHTIGLNMLLDIVIPDYNALCPIKAKSCTCWQLSHVDYLLSLSFLMVVAAQNTNNTTIKLILLAEKLTGSNFTNWYRNLGIVLRYEKKIKFVEQPTGPALDSETADPDTIDKYYETVNIKQEEEGQLVSSYLLKMKSYLDTLERLRYAIPNEPSVSLILNSLNKDYDQFVQNYNMHNMGKTIDELHAMLKLHEKGAKGKDKGKNKLSYAPKPKIPPPPKRDNPAKDSVCHHCKEVVYWRRNCSSYQAKLKKRKNASVASTSGIFTIELYACPNKTWVYDTGCATHICNTLHGLRESRKLKHGALSLYMGNGMRAAVEAIGSFDFILPSGLIIVLDNCHFAHSVTMGVVSISRLVNNGYIHTFTNYGISVSKDNVFYFNAIPCDGIYEIDLRNLYPNVIYMFNVSNKRAKHALKSSYLWHCHLGHINKKHMDKLHRDEILQPTHDESLEKCKSCISGKMARKPFPHQVERAKDLLGLIHTDVCGPLELCQERVLVTSSPLHTILVVMVISARIPQALDRYGFYVDVEEYELGDLNEPPNYKAALSYLEFDKWIEAMNTEMQSMKDNQVWGLVDLPPNGRTVESKWLFKKKTDMDGNVHTFKARLVAKGSTQTYGVDYGETFCRIS